MMGNETLTIFWDFVHCLIF